MPALKWLAVGRRLNADAKFRSHWPYGIMVDEVTLGDFFSKFFGVLLSVLFHIHYHIHLSVGDTIQPSILKASLN